MEQVLTIEQRVSSAILEKKVGTIEIEGKVYDIASPTIATLILISEVVSTLPIVSETKDNMEIINSVLHYAKDYRPLGDIAAILILGANHLTEQREIEQRKFLGLIPRKKRYEIIDKKAELSQLILDNVRPTVLFNIIIQRLKDMEIASFFAITTSLSEANILKPTKEVVS